MWRAGAAGPKGFSRSRCSHSAVVCGQTGGLQTSGVVTYTVPVASGTAQLNATLVWSDYPSNPSAASNLVNDLDFKITSPMAQSIGAMGQLAETGSTTRGNWNHYT